MHDKYLVNDVPWCGRQTVCGISYYNPQIDVDHKYGTKYDKMVEGEMQNRMEQDIEWNIIGGGTKGARGPWPSQIFRLMVLAPQISFNLLW